MQFRDAGELGIVEVELFLQPEQFGCVVRQQAAVRGSGEEVERAVARASEEQAANENEESASRVSSVESVGTGQSPGRNAVRGFCPSSQSSLARASSQRPSRQTKGQSRMQQPTRDESLRSPAS